MGFLFFIIVFIIIFTFAIPAIKMEARTKNIPTETHNGMPVRPDQMYDASYQAIKAVNKEKEPVKERKVPIVENAKKNTAKYEKNVTKAELEKMHGHTENFKEEEVRHSKGCANATAENVILTDESFLGSVEDLMVKGYDGELHNQRDFVGEGIDMINSFTNSR